MSFFFERWNTVVWQDFVSCVKSCFLWGKKNCLTNIRRNQTVLRRSTLISVALHDCCFGMKGLAHHVFVRLLLWSLMGESGRVHRSVYWVFEPCFPNFSKIWKILFASVFWFFLLFPSAQRKYVYLSFIVLVFFRIYNFGSISKSLILRSSMQEWVVLNQNKSLSTSIWGRSETAMSDFNNLILSP